jgi:hypothetical protein
VGRIRIYDLLVVSSNSQLMPRAKDLPDMIATTPLQLPFLVGAKYVCLIQRFRANAATESES